MDLAGPVLLPNRLTAASGRRSGLRSLALDSSAGGAASVVYALQTVDYDWSEAERLGRRAIVLNPRDTQSRFSLASVLVSIGRLAEADSQIRRAWQTDSLDPGIGWFVTGVMVANRRYEELLAWAPRLRISSRNARLFANIGLRRYDSAFAVARGPVDSALVLGAMGRIEEGRSAMARFKAQDDVLRATGDVAGDEDNQAMGWIAVGDLDRAFACLEMSYQVRSGSYLAWIKAWPWFDPLRNDPRYHDLLRRMNLE